MRVILAPMQGVLDHLMREVLTSVNDYDLCVSEFIRVVDQLLPAKVFYRIAPELKQGGKTRAGTPVRVQLLGQHPEWLAENAVRAIERRMEKLAIDPNRDRVYMLKVQSVEADYKALLAKIPKSQLIPAEVANIRWMIEELRVSFFAQNLGTPYPVSDKRVLNAIAQC